ncbi:Fe-S cluster assembly protein SufD [Capnocytophaga catalasegens]|uniref:Fe-S cluster assembly protein SufD n=2 Tax=Capnocytophaga catalasegens TaxID=1004260 RepID=A0AAV5AVS5_9FLAO|nr:Fe-S cluster assembly protein SufD [Capnocytophaga catalasegens]GJM49613.1 Fe-S cluster assembly protein SufD [Capnocytophaga catalasegens]GJM52904.1 Fe-S cluster assembly protein SufD [Capnocytophaga catalasegens]
MKENKYKLKYYSVLGKLKKLEKMNLQEKWITSFENFANKNDILKYTRKEALSFFAKKGFPTRKDEAWRFTSLSNLTKNDFSLFPARKTQVSAKDIESFWILPESYKIVFVDGVFCSELSHITTDALLISPLRSILDSENGKEFTTNYFNKEVAQQDVFTALNTAFANDGVCLYVPKGKIIEKPVELLFVATDLGQAMCYQPRNIIEVGENAQIRIIETHYNLSKEKVLTNVVTEIFVREHAILDYYKIQNDNLYASLIDNTYISQDKRSNVSVHTFSFGGELTRNNLNFFHKGEYLESTLKGLSILSKRQHVDNYTLVNHAQPNCESHQDYKAILSEESAGVFNGKIMVDKIAQKTNAYQQNDTILLSQKATINTKPQLEIFADDVKCSHGCTIGELNKEVLFYLQTRGIPKKEGETLLTYAFANTVLESVKIPELEILISAMISNKLRVNISI